MQGLAPRAGHGPNNDKFAECYRPVGACAWGAGGRRRWAGGALFARRRVCHVRAEFAQQDRQRAVRICRITRVDSRLSADPKHSLGMALDDCHDAYQWLRARGYRPEQIVLAGDSAGGYLALALAQRLQCDDEKPAAIVAISPLLQLAKGPKQDHPNIGTDAMFPARAFDALAAWVRAAAAKNMVDGRPEDLYEPLDHIESSLPPTLIHVSGSEVLLHDAQLGAGKLAAAGVCAEVRVWPGQAHLFQLATPLVPEATRSLRQIGQFIRDATADSSLSPVHRSRYVAGSPRAASRGAFGQSPI